MPSRVKRFGKLLTITLSLATILSCGGTSTPTLNPPPPSTERPAASPTFNLEMALDTLRARANLLQTGGLKPQPFVLDWDQIQAGVALNAQQNKAFCDALETPRLDDVASSLVAAGLSWLAVKLHHEPVSEETEDMLKLGATFAVTTCPSWVPIVNPVRPLPTVAPQWPPDGYSLVLGDSDLAWRWSAKGTFQCQGPAKTCWQIDVLARYGCNQVKARLYVRLDGVPIEPVDGATLDVPVNIAAPLGFGTPRTSTGLDGELIYLSCV